MAGIVVSGLAQGFEGKERFILGFEPPISEDDAREVASILDFEASLSRDSEGMVYEMSGDAGDFTNPDGHMLSLAGLAIEVAGELDRQAYNPENPVQAEPDKSIVSTVLYPEPLSV